jgi:GAF domain-containing protein
MGQQHRQPNDENLLVALGRVLQTMREEENADVLIETVLDYLQSEFDYRLIWIGLYDRLDHRLFGKGGFTPDGDTTFLKQRFNLNPGDILEQVVIQQRPVGVSDLRQEVRAGEWRRVAQQYEVQGALLFPLRCKDRCFGVALLGSHLWGVSPRPGEKAQLSLLLGGLAAALYQIEVDWQRSATKHPDQVMFQMLDQLLKLPSLELRLDSIVNMTQQFVASTRTSIYWYSPERRYFWHRVGNLQSIRRFGERRTGAAGITVAEANDFYQALSGGQLVAIGAGRSPLKANSTGHLLGRLRARSLLAAPIKSDSELLGFLAVEDNEARIWEEAERQYIRATAQIVALVVEREHLETTLQQSSQDSHFAAAMSNAIATATNTNTALKNCAKLLSDRLETERFMVLREAEDGQFHLLYQQQPPNRRSLTAPLTVLGETDRQRLASVAAPIVIEDWEDDVQLLPWREVLLPLGVHSALLVSLHQTLPGDNTTQTRKGLLIVAHDTPRTWNQTERNLVSVTSQQIALLLSFDDFRASTEQATVTHQQLLTGLDILWNAPPAPDQFERAWMEHLASLLECSLAAVLSWTPQTPTATITAAVVANSRFALSPVTIPVADDALIQEALITPGLCSRNVADLPAATRRWLNIPGITQVYAIALYTGELAPTGMVILAGDAGTRLSDRWRSLVETLMSQFAWLRHYRRLSAVKGSEVTDLQTLNWYKHRCLDTRTRLLPRASVPY